MHATRGLAVVWEYFALGVCQNAFVSASTDSIAFTAMLFEADQDPRFVAHANRNWILGVAGDPDPGLGEDARVDATGVDADTSEHKTPGLEMAVWCRPRARSRGGST